jgi:predicted metal-binding membrane protein
LWVAAITIFVLIEKAVPYGDMTGRISAVALMLAGPFVIVQSLIT